MLSRDDLTYKRRMELIGRDPNGDTNLEVGDTFSPTDRLGLFVQGYSVDLHGRTTLSIYLSVPDVMQLKKVLSDWLKEPPRENSNV